VNTARSAGVSIYEFPDDGTSAVVDQSAKDSGATISSDTVAPSSQDPPGLLEPNPDEDDFFRTFIASQIDEFLPVVDENGSTEHAETQIVDMFTKALNGVNASQSTNGAGLVPLESTGPPTRPGPGGETPCNSDETNISSDDSQHPSNKQRLAKPQEFSSTEDGSSTAETDESVSASGTGEKRCWTSLAVLVSLDSNPACLSSEDDDNSRKRTSSSKRKRAAESHVTMST
jgi:hypothetical protein